MVALSYAAVNTVAVMLLATHTWWAGGNGFQKYVDILRLLKERRDLSTKRAKILAEKASFKLFTVICKIFLQFALLVNLLVTLFMINACASHELQLLAMIVLYGACLAVGTDVIALTKNTCDRIAVGGHFLLLVSVLCPSSDIDFLMMGGGRALLRALAGILFPDLRTVLSANMVISLASIWKLSKAAQAIQGGNLTCYILSAICSEITCIVQVMFLFLLVRRLVNENLEVNLENIDITGKSHARRNLLSVLVDADITLDSNLRICAPSNKAQHLLAQDLTHDKTSLEGLKFHRLVAEADRSKLREFLNRAGMVNETVDLQSESSTSLQGGGSPASSMSIQMGESGRLLQIFHASIPAMEGEERKKQPRHLVGIQEQFSAQDFGETAEPQMYMDHTTDAEQVYLSTQNLAAQQQGFEGRQRRPPSTGSRGSRDSRGSASSASSLRSSVAGLPEISSVNLIFNGYSEGLSIVEATLRFDTFRGEQNRGEPARLPEMRHWIRSRHWDQFRNWVQTETQRCCAGQVDQVKSFEGPLEFYYPGQPDMTLVAGSVNVMGIQNDWDSEMEEDEEEDAEQDEVEGNEGNKPGIRNNMRLTKRGKEQAQAYGAQSGGSTDSMGVNISPAGTDEGRVEAEEDQECQAEVFGDNPLIDHDGDAEVDALLVEVECKAFSQYRKLSTKPRKSKRYGHLCRNRPLEPSLDAIPERP